MVDFDADEFLQAIIQKIAEEGYDIQNMDEEELKEVLFETITEAAQDGDSNAQFYLGLVYFNGDNDLNVEQNYKKAIKWLSRAGRRGHVEAQWLLGSCYLSGVGVNQDVEEAVEWLTMAAEQGNPDAQTALGGCYAAGLGVEQDVDVAISWYKKAAIQGNKEATAALAITLGGEILGELFDD